MASWQERSPAQETRTQPTSVDDASLRAEIGALLREQERAAEREAAVRDVIQTIARTTFDLDAVLQTVIDRAVELCRADNGNIARRDGDVYRVVAFTRFAPDFERLVRERIYVPERGSVIGRALLERRIVQIPDVLADPEYTLTEIRQAGRYRTLLGVPMLRDGMPIGTMVLGRTEVRPFDDAEIRLIETFADHAVIAIENVRLFQIVETARDAAMDAAETKSRFLANMSHELRTPLNAIIGFTRIVRRNAGALPAKQVDNLSKILISAERLLGLIDEILELSRLEAGEARVELERTDLVGLLNEVADSLDSLVDGTKVRLSVTAQGDLPTVLTDRGKLRQIVLNLLSNAIKYTDEGTIDLRARVANERLRIQVQDTGVGIPPDELTKIFDEFHRPDSAHARQRRGTGLGLSISQRLAHLLGGDVTAESVLGVGSTFTIDLPVVVTQKAGVS
jgi:signal transduction histidine kinase